MVTCPDEYPLWRTRRPIALTVPPHSDIVVGGGAILCHRYRYLLIVTPGASSAATRGAGTTTTATSNVRRTATMTTTSTCEGGGWGLVVNVPADGDLANLPYRTVRSTDRRLYVKDDRSTIERTHG